MYQNKLILTALILGSSAPLVSQPVFAAPIVGVPAPAKAEVPQTGVNITSVTRNASNSKITLPLAQGAVALLPIVISEKAGDATKLAAAELKKYLDQMSGASFEIKTGDGQSGIVLGNIAEFPTPVLNEALKIVNSFDGKEAYAIRTQANRVLLIGATDLGTSHAAYRFLEELGCRWFFPDATDNWQVIPKVADLKFNRDITARPAFLSRSIWYAWWIFGDPLHPQSTPESPRSAAGDYGDWKRRNHMAESFTSNTGHAYDTIVRENAAEFEKHPEYYALVGGKRQGNQLEVGNPGLRFIR